jgi:hypothetical protein
MGTLSATQVTRGTHKIEYRTPWPLHGNIDVHLLVHFEFQQ